MRESAGIRVLTPGLAVYTNLSRSGEEIEPRIGAFESDFGINSLSEAKTKTRLFASSHKSYYQSSNIGRSRRDIAGFEYSDAMKVRKSIVITDVTTIMENPTVNISIYL